MQRQYAAFAEAEGMEAVTLDHSGMQKVSNPSPLTPSAACCEPHMDAAAPRSSTEVLGDSMSGTVKLTVGQAIELVRATPESADSSAESEGSLEIEFVEDEADSDLSSDDMARLTKTPEAVEVTEPEPEEPRDVTLAREVCRGRARPSPGGPQIEMSVVRAPYGSSGRTVPTVRRPDREEVPISKHDLRMFAGWSYLVSEIQQARGIQCDLYVALDNTSAAMTRAGQPAETAAYCIGQAVVICTRASIWGVRKKGLGPKAHMGKPNNRSRLIRIATHEMAHAISNGEGHGPAWMEAEKSLWYRIDLAALSKEIAKIFRLTAAELTENLPRAD